MDPGADAPDLSGRTADASLLDAAPDELPSDVDRPPRGAPSPHRSWLVGTGVTLTGLALIAGIGLTILGIVKLASGHGSTGLLALIVGLVLVATHWGWVHVAEGTANALDHRRLAPEEHARQRWLEQLAPFDRYTVTTTVGDDGTIAIERIHDRPIATDEHHFTFAREVAVLERHPSDTPAAVVAERAELLRRDAAARTARARARYAERAQARLTQQLRADVDAPDHAASAAAARALSEQINAHLRDPPLPDRDP